MGIGKTTDEVALKYREPTKYVHLAIQGMVGLIDAESARGKMPLRVLLPH
jgi:hypothetical protein